MVSDMELKSKQDWESTELAICISTVDLKAKIKKDIFKYRFFKSSHLAATITPKVPEV